MSENIHYSPSNYGKKITLVEYTKSTRHVESLPKLYIQSYVCILFTDRNKVSIEK